MGGYKTKTGESWMQQDAKTLKSTIMILGAGASAEFGMPTWNELKEKLEELATKQKTHPSLIQSFQNKKTYFNMLTMIMKGNIKGKTIDERFSNFMDENCQNENNFIFNGYEIDGELFEDFFWGSIEYIFYSILKEKGSRQANKNFILNYLDAREMKTTWLDLYVKSFAKSLVKNKQFNLVIDFNYDNLFHSIFSYETQYQNYLLSEDYELLKHYTNTQREKLLEIDELKKQYNEIEKIEKSNLSYRKRRVDGTTEKEVQIKKTEIEKNLSRNRSLRDIMRDSIEHHQFNFKVEDVVKNSQLNIFQPHGYFDSFSVKNPNTSFKPSKPKPEYSNKSLRGNEPISCYDTREGRFHGIHKNIEDNTTEEIIILGVGTTAIEYNLSKLKLEKTKGTVKRVFFTCYEPKEISIYKNFFKKTFGQNVALIHEKTCSELIDRLIKEY